MRTRDRDSRPSAPNALPLHADKALLKAFHSGVRLESPQGGRLEPLGVRHSPDGTGRVLFECNTSSLRYELRIPKGTRREREKVRDLIKDGMDPTCPRCVLESRLSRVGANLVCGRCGVAYQKA